MNRLTVIGTQLTENRFTVQFECTGSLKNYFKSNEFFVEYDSTIENVPLGILMIPFLGVVCPIAWVNNADVYVDEVDENYLMALQRIKAVFQCDFPRMKFSGFVTAKKIVKLNVSSNSKSMMLFSGGLDSIVTYIRHRHEKPVLASIHGADVSISNFGAWNKLVNSLKDFSCEHGSDLKLIQSNFRSIIDEFLLDECYKIGFLENWYAGVGHGLALLSLCAPVAYAEKISILYIASSMSTDFPSVWGSNPQIDNNIEWSGTKVQHDCYELTRQKKANFLADYLKTTGKRVLIRSCWKLNRGDNCSVCKKCYLTIIGLELAGIDPNVCGFSLQPDTFSKIKRIIMTGEFIDPNDYTIWIDFQRHARQNAIAFHADAEDLISYLKVMDIDALVKQQNQKRSIISRMFQGFAKHLPISFYVFLKRESLKFGFYRLVKREKL